MARKITIEFLGNARDLQKTVNQVEGSTSTLGSKLKKVGIVAAAGFAAAGAGAVKFGVDAIGSASDLNETLSKSEAIFGKQAPAMEKWAGAAAKSAGLSKSAALEAASGFGDMFSQIGFAQGAAADMSTDVVQLSADLGSFNNLETADVADRMSAAFRGEYDSLQAVIPNINAARVESEALAATGKATAKELTAQEKAAAVLAIVHKDGARAMGDFERTSGGLANQQKILRAQFENVQASIGQKLLPIAVKLTTWANDVALPAFAKFAGWLGDKIPPVFEKVKAVIKGFLGGTSGSFSDTFNDIRSIFKDAISIIQSLWKAFGGNITSYVKTSMKNIKTIFSGAFKIIRGIFKTVSALLKGDWKGAWDGIKMILKGAWQLIVGLVKQGFNLLKFAFKNAGVVLRGVMKAIWDGIKSLVSSGVSSVVDAVRSIPGKLGELAGRFGTVGKQLITAFINGMKGAGGLVADIAGNVWTGVKGLLNSAIGQINRALEFRISLPLGKSISINPPDIPYLAKGGIVTRPTLAVVGEDGPEAVVPLTKRNMPAGVGVGGGAAPVIININGALDPVAVGRQVEQLLIKYTRSTGRPLQIHTA